jgi:O-antigen/teichoic acid export membrane protein
MPSSNTNRIIKNTLLLYFRMLLLMAVSLYTVRVVLNVLGIVDYGINNVVGGVVVMLAFLRASMALASQRFLSFELGKKDYVQLKKTFQISITIYFIIALFVVAILETVGLWFLRNYIVIPPSRIEAAAWIFQFMILSSVVAITITPYNAAIIAHEKMSVYAYASLVEAGLKLLIAFLLPLFAVDKLKLYSVLSFAVILLNALMYYFFCRAKFEECRFKFYWDQRQFRILMSYLGWNLFGSVSGVLRNQGVNILINMFFGPTVNAARAVAFQVSSALSSFIQNYTTSVRPQIIKSFAIGDRDYMLRLVFKSTKFMYFLMLTLSMPVLLETPFILGLWLKQVPDYTVIFTRLVVIDALITSLSYPIMAVNHATGNIKLFQSVVGGLLILNLPISYVCLRLGAQPQNTMIVSIILSLMAIMARLFILERQTAFPVIAFCRRVLFVSALVSAISFIAPFLLSLFLDKGLLRFLIVGATGCLSCGATMLSIGLTKDERRSAFALVRRIVARLGIKYPAVH